MQSQMTSHVVKRSGLHSPSGQSQRTRLPCTCAAGRSPVDVNRRVAITSLVSFSALLGASRTPLAYASPVTAISPVVVRPELSPDQTKYDPSDARLREAMDMLQEGLNAGDLKAEEAQWTKIIEEYSGVDAPWVPDVVGRAYGNRGNAISRQGRLEDALVDYNKAIEICPWSVDPVLNRGVALNQLSRFEEAITDYRAVLAAQPDDPAAWNNIGNATAGLGKWEEAIGYFRRATLLSPGFSFAAANLALALYQIGQKNEAVKSMRSLLRKYPEFPDMRAALAAALWADGLEDQAEASWLRVDDTRYRDRRWVRDKRHWPPSLAAALEALLDVKSMPPGQAVL